jgi:thioredoxin-related protein
MKFLIAFIFIFQTAYCQDSVTVGAPIFGTYDPSANPDIQLKEAIARAQKENKRILLDVGGEWCKWCHFLDRFFEENTDVTDYLKSHFVLVKINFSKENLNEEFLKTFPKVPGYPHFFVLNSDGTFLHSQDTGKLEKGQGHDHDKVLNFLKEWSAKKEIAK